MNGRALVLAHPRRARRRALDARWLLLGLAAGLVVWLVSAPLAFFPVTAFRRTEDVLPFEAAATWTLANFADVFGNPVLYRAVLPDTLLYTAGAVAVALTLGAVFAWLVERTNVPLSDALFVALVSPVIVPTVVGAFAWVLLLGPNTGYFNVLIRWVLGRPGPGPLDVFSFGGLILAQGLALVPLTFLFMAVAFRNMDPALEEASALAGARPLTTFLRVTRPALTPAILALLIVVTTLTLEGFEIPLVIGVPAGVKVLSTWMFFAVNPPIGLPNYGRVAAIAVPFLGLGVGLLALYNRALRVAERYATVTGRAYRPRRVDLGRWRYPALALVALYLLLVQQQRVALARALVARPKLLLLDEPLSNLDARLREQMRDELRSLVAMLGITALYVTHDRLEALALSHRIAVMAYGRIVQQGAPAEIYGRPCNRFVADFLGGANFLPVTVGDAEDGGARAALADGTVLHCRDAGRGAARGRRAVVLVRPEDVELDREPATGAPDVLAAEVEHVVFQGSFAEVRTRTPCGPLTFRVRPAQAPAPGDRVRIPPDACTVLEDGSGDREEPGR